MAEARIKAVITAEDKASSVVAGFGGAFAKMAGGVAAGIAIFETLKAATMGVIGVFGDSIKAFQQAELATARLQAGIRNVTSATDKNIDGLLDQASALERVTRFSDDSIVSAQGILTTFQLNQKAITALTPRLLDMSEGLAKASGAMPDLESNAMLVAKALGGEDVEGLVGSLRRVGIVLNAHQEQILKTGTFEQRLSTITQVLDQNFKDMSVSAGQTSAGQMMILQNAINNLQEQFGAALSTALLPFIAKLTEWAQSDQARATIQSIADKVAAMITQFGIFLRDHWPEIKNALINMAAFAYDAAKAIGYIYDKAQQLKGIGNFAIGLSPVGAVRNFGKMLNIPGFADGVSNFGGGPAIVGERGPELVNLPRGSSVTPNSAIGGVTNVNVSFNGVFTGNPQDMRRLSEMVADSLKDLANKQNKTPMQLLGG